MPKFVLLFGAKAATLHLPNTLEPLALHSAFSSFENIQTKETMPGLPRISTPCRPLSSTRTPPA
ncbi:hypothetical protein BCAR13_100141 [Paraburkholderia caribensis]|nr:hypothetical protein BCAR13_100141 [Paraburkholderia caribensis]